MFKIKGDVCEACVKIVIQFTLNTALKEFSSLTRIVDSNNKNMRMLNNTVKIVLKPMNFYHGN